MYGNNTPSKYNLLSVVNMCMGHVRIASCEEEERVSHDYTKGVELDNNLLHVSIHLLNPISKQYTSHYLADHKFHVIV